MKKDSRSRDVTDEIAAFERQHPQIAEAMKLFDITMTEYQGAMNAMNGPRIYHTSSSTNMTRGQHGKSR